jgi:hypothetical protein
MHTFKLLGIGGLVTVSSFVLFFFAHRLVPPTEPLVAAILFLVCYCTATGLGVKALLCMHADLLGDPAPRDLTRLTWPCAFASLLLLTAGLTQAYAIKVGRAGENLAFAHSVEAIVLYAGLLTITAVLLGHSHRPNNAAP